MASRPGEEIAFDFLFIGDESCELKWILVGIDSFSRVVELYPSVAPTAAEAAKGLLEWTSRYGVPKRIRSDKGSHFMANMMKEFTLLLGVKHVVSIPYHHESNGIVERVNKEVLRHIRALLLDSGLLRSHWNECIPLIRRIINTSEHSVIGTSPYRLVFGDMMSDSPGFMEPAKGGDHDISVNMDEYLQRLCKSQRLLLAKAQDLQRKVQEEKLQGMPDCHTSFQQGDYVLKSVREEASYTKLAPPWSGPFLVLNQRGSLVKIENLVTQAVDEVHVSRLKPYLVNVHHHDPETVAIKGMNMFALRGVLKHVGSIKKRSTMKFLIEWEDRPPEFATWESWRNVSKCQVVLEYLASLKK